MPRKKDSSPETLAARKLRRREWYKEWHRKYKHIKTEKRLLWAARSRAKRKGLECTIKESDIVIPEYCPYLGIKLIPHLPRGSKRGPIATLDRIDSTKGYIPGNVEVISWQANTIKTNASVEELINFAKEILKRHGAGTGL